MSQKQSGITVCKAFVKGKNSRKYLLKPVTCFTLLRPIIRSGWKSRKGTKNKFKTIKNRVMNGKYITTLLLITVKGNENAVEDKAIAA